jgi:hypothetical protein
MLPLLLLAAAAEEAPDLIAAARTRTAAERRCVRDPGSTDVTVCGLRGADRFRVPFVGPEPGDPRHEGVAAERERLLARSNPVKDLSPFLVGGGMAGVSVSTGLGPGGGLQARTLAR